MTNEQIYNLGAWFPFDKGQSRIQRYHLQNGQEISQMVEILQNA